MREFFARETHKSREYFRYKGKLYIKLKLKDEITL